MSNTDRAPRTIAIIPCGADKATSPTTAADLYIGAMFTYVLRVARTIAADADIYILSALHGLVALDDIVAPYDLRMGQPGSVTADTIATQATARDIAWGDDVYLLLPTAYRDVALDGLDTIDVWGQDVYEDLAGIGYQRGTCRNILDTAVAFPVAS